MAFMSPEEVKQYEKERLNYIKAAEKALKREDLNAVIENFRKIVEASNHLGDTKMAEEFTQKLGVLTQGQTDGNIAVEYQQVQMTISDFINDLIEAPNRIISSASTPIPVDPKAQASTPIPAPLEPTIFPELDIKKVETLPEDEVSIESEISSRGNLDQQLSDLKKILEYRKGS